MNTAPIILFVYTRREHALHTLECLLANDLAKESDLYIFSDGPAVPEEEEPVRRLRADLRGVEGFRKVVLTERTEHYGLARSVLEGVTSLLRRYDRVIVMEDDLVVSPFFLRFMNDALETYKDIPEVGHVHGCEFTQDASLPETFLIRWAGSWGWGTWSRAWSRFRPDAAALEQELKARGLQHEFDFNGRYGYSRMLHRQAVGKIDSWAIRWNASLFLSGMLSLNAGRSLVRNTGFDGSGTHCGKLDIYNTPLCDRPLNVSPIHPPVENKAARAAYVRFYARTNSFWAKAKRRILRTLHGDFGA